MSKQHTTKESKHDSAINNDSKPQYNSNPFTLSFNAFSKLMQFNSGWGIALIAMSLLSGLANLIQVFLDAAINSDTAHAMTIAQSTIQFGNIGLPELSILIAFFVFVLVITLVAVVAGTAIGAFIQGMFSYVALKSIEGHKVSFNEAVDAVSKRFMRLFLSNLLATLKIIGWTILFIIPGIIAGLRYALLSFVIMDEPIENKGIKTSHERVKLLTRGRLMEVFGVNTVGSLIPIVGGVITLAGGGSLYRQLQVYGDNNIEKPKIHWLNYIGIILIGVLVALVSLLLILLLVISIVSS